MNDSPEAAALGSLLSFLRRGPTPSHCVEHAASLLRRAGYRPLSCDAPWEIVHGQGYYVARHGALVAFRPNHDTAIKGMRILSAHTDSPNLRLKPNIVRSSGGYAQFDVDVYGQALLHTWLDRDLGVAGTIHYENAGKMCSVLVSSEQPICRIPSLAIHLDPEVSRRGLVLNSQAHLAPLVAASIDEKRLLRELFEGQLGIVPTAIRGHDLSLFDMQPAQLTGLDQEFICSARLDNQLMCHAALRALLNSAGDATAVVVLFDHEEVGSRSAEGAQGALLRSVVERLLPSASTRWQALAKSFVVSADMGHALHPNYPERHDPRHAPVLNGGLILRTNVNQRYATEAHAQALFRQLCHDCGVSVQEFVNRPDLACGSTLAPMLAAHLGAPVVDIGCPALAMHSIREVAGTQDYLAAVRAMQRVLSCPSLD